MESDQLTEPKEKGEIVQVESNSPSLKPVKPDGQLYKKYRPLTWDEIRGNEAVVEGLKSLFSSKSEKDRPHVFLLHGPSGCGKTTIARIITRELKCQDSDFIEVNGANTRGIDTVREVIQHSYYSPWGEARVFLLDEAHKITKEAQNALLKILEDTPQRTYFILCTTEPDGIIETIKTRCTTYQVNPLTSTMIRDLLDWVCNEEGKKVADELLEAISENCNGSARKALVFLSQVIDVSDPKKALELVTPMTGKGRGKIEKKKEPQKKISPLTKRSEKTNGAETLKDSALTSTLTAQEEEEACKLLKRSSLLYRIGEDIQRAGVAGEKRNGLIIYLCISSRIQKHPLSLLIKGQSSSGKNYLLRKVIQFFPQNSYKELTGMSKQALIYSDESLAHKAILICEKEGMDKALYNIRALQSEGRLVFETVQKGEEGRLVTEHIEKEGPVSFIVTTTSTQIHPENETRNWSIFMDESDEQTGRVKNKTAEDYLDFNSDLSFLKAYQNAQRMMKYYPVKIPYGKFLSERTPNWPLRMRRDFEKLLVGIEIITLLHQFQRDFDEENGIQFLEATLQDYYMATTLLGSIFEESLSGTSQMTGKIIDAIFSLHQKNERPVTSKDLVKELNISRDTIETWVAPAIKNGEVVVRPSRGRIPKTYSPGIRKDCFNGMGLPSVKELAKAFPALPINFTVTDPIDGRVVGDG
jgi:DNA polymerase III delta prime subunit